MSIAIIKSVKMIYVLEQKQMKYAYNFKDFSDLMLWVDTIIVKDQQRESYDIQLREQQESHSLKFINGVKTNQLVSIIKKNIEQCSSFERMSKYVFIADLKSDMKALFEDGNQIESFKHLSDQQQVTKVTLQNGQYTTCLTNAKQIKSLE